MRYCYLDGDFVPEHEATVGLFDRGFLFAESVYEVIAVVNGRFVDLMPHLQRFVRSCQGIGIDYSLDKLVEVMELVREHNQLRDGVVYAQITLGDVGERSFYRPKHIEPKLYAFTQEKDFFTPSLEEKAIKVMTVPDIRWQYRHLKTTMLMPSAMLKSQARQQGFDDIWYVEEDYVTEGGSNNPVIVKDGQLITRPASQALLDGITRRTLKRLAAEHDHEIVERKFSVVEAQLADEVFTTSASTFVLPVVSIDGVQVNNGKVGGVTRQMYDIYAKFTCTGNERGV